MWREEPVGVPTGGVPENGTVVRGWRCVGFMGASVGGDEDTRRQVVEHVAVAKRKECGTQPGSVPILLQSGTPILVTHDVQAVIDRALTDPRHCPSRPVERLAFIRRDHGRRWITFKHHDAEVPLAGHFLSQDPRPQDLAPMAKATPSENTHTHTYT